MKNLPENFTDAEHAAWVRQMEKEEKRRDILAKVVVYGGVGAWLLYSYLNSNSAKPEHMGLWVVAGIVAFCIAYSFEQRLNTIIKKLEAIEDRLGRVNF